MSDTTKKKHKLTAKEVNYFVERVRHWVKVLSLGDWKIEAYSKKLTDMSAACETWRNARGAHIMINEELDYPPARKWLDRIALHEVGHVLLYDMKELINCRVVTDGMIETAEHSVIRRLENALK